jgi:cyclopropane fatty-acyl-phospholipid synthase-like methyltransferase
MDDARKQKIINYYDTCERHYRQWWGLDRSLAIHAGFWDETTKTLHDALIRENEKLASIAKIQPSDHVLDAGCGIGGSSIYLAETIGCLVTGITLSEKQVQTAVHKAADRHLVKTPSFLVRDYTNTGFPEASFDVVWAIESVCHAEDKRLFVREAHRILRPGGRLILADGFNVRNSYTPAEKRLLDKAMHGWAVDSMESIPNFDGFLRDQNFQNITMQDATPYVLPSSRRLFAYSFPAIALSKLGEWLGWSSKLETQDYIGYHYQFWAIKKQLAKYIIFYAEK